MILWITKCIDEHFRIRKGLMGAPSGAMISKILYRFGNEDLVLSTTTSANMDWGIASGILQWINP